MSMKTLFQIFKRGGLGDRTGSIMFSALRLFALSAISALMLLLISAIPSDQKRSLYLVGDSTVKNGSGKGEGGLWGWGDFLGEQLDTSRLHIENDARGGRSSRTYIAEGLWDAVLLKIKKGDIVLIQFGHNDAGPVNDTIRARGTIRGIGEETEEIDNMITKKHEIIHTFGWYLRKYLRDTKAKGGIPILISRVAQNNWKDGKVVRATEDYALWTRQIAEREDVSFIDLNDLVATKYEQLGPEVVTSKIFLTDKTHTTMEGARINAAIVAAEMRRLKIIQ
jgi:rhamnogalacturonan acetylesterase